MLLRCLMLLVNSFFYIVLFLNFLSFEDNPRARSGATSTTYIGCLILNTVWIALLLSGLVVRAGEFRKFQKYSRTDKKLDNLHFNTHSTHVTKCQFSGNTRDRVLFSSIYKKSTYWFCKQILKENSSLCRRILQLPTKCWRCILSKFLSTVVQDVSFEKTIKYLVRYS